MTTEVIIKNSKDSHNLVKINGEMLLASIPPGGEYSAYIWSGREITISEGGPILVSYRNPNNLTGPVFIEEDGTIRSLTTRDI